MNLFSQFQQALRKMVAEQMRDAGQPSQLQPDQLVVAPPRDRLHGDMSTNFALSQAKSAGLEPQGLALWLADIIREHPQVTCVGVAGPGFVNWQVDDDCWRALLKESLQVGTAFGDNTLGSGISVNLEFVSANPTGPLHIANARGAVVGDTLGRLLEKAGYRVTREYYVNDAGEQVDILARSAHRRYLQALGQSTEAIPQGWYPGEYLCEVGEVMAQIHGRGWLEAPESEWLPIARKLAIEHILSGIRSDLEALGVRMDIYSHESALVESKLDAKAISILEQQGATYFGTQEPPKGKLADDWEPKEQLLFRSSLFGDDSDRTLRKSDGCNTYFVNDLAYHLDKYQRGFALQVNVWGADHAGYIKRLQAGVKLLTHGQARLEVLVCQLVHLLQDGKPLKMSKRTGQFVTLRELVEQVGAGVVRFIMLTRRCDQGLTFDRARVTEQSKDNPVFYVQYAHARCCSVLRHAAQLMADQRLTYQGFKDVPAEIFGDAVPGLTSQILAQGPLEYITDPGELQLIRVLADWPRVVESAALAFEPHRIAFYLCELASEFHGLWHQGQADTELRFLRPDAPELTWARLALVKGVANVIASGMEVIGIEPLEEMH